MRARYYSPDMRRFINADIIPGELSNAITLNRFAYANGNPVSYTDPFGLSVLPWQSMPYKNLEKEKKRLINACEKLDSLKRAGLQIESFFNQGYSNFLFTSSLSGILLNVGHDHINLHYNKALEETNDYIYFQEKVSFKLGVHDFSWCGCEVVAVYNAMKAANYSPSVADIVLEFQENGVIIGNHLVSGALGGNPYSISKALDAMDVKYKSIPLEQMTENSSYILSYWNYPNSINPSIHTIAIVKTKDGYATYNYKRNPTFQNIDEIVKQFGDAFITAYQIVERK